MPASPRMKKAPIQSSAELSIAEIARAKKILSLTDDFLSNNTIERLKGMRHALNVTARQSRPIARARLERLAAAAREISKVLNEMDVDGMEAWELRKQYVPNDLDITAERGRAAEFSEKANAAAEGFTKVGHAMKGDYETVVAVLAHTYKIHHQEWPKKSNSNFIELVAMITNRDDPSAIGAALDKYRPQVKRGR